MSSARLVYQISRERERPDSMDAKLRGSRDSAIRFLNEAIGSGRYGPGAKLPPERMLSAQSGLPRHALRDALAVLETEGRIVRIVGSGTYVADAARNGGRGLSHARDASPAEILEARFLLEPRLAVLAVVNATAADFERMEDWNRRAETADGIERFEACDTALHQAIAEATHNRLVIALYGAITEARGQAEWGELKQRSLTAERREACGREHRAILAALRARDAARAEAALLDHLRHSRLSLLGR